MDVVAFLKGLAPFAPAAQFIAYSLLTMASVIVAATQLFLAYRQNFGWRPLVLVASQSFTLPRTADGQHEARYGVEVWNRRKYPIVVRDILVSFDHVKLVRRNGIEPTDWPIVEPSTLWLSPSDVVEGNAQKIYHPVAIFMSLDELEGKARIAVRYFDPRVQRVRTCSTQARANILDTLK